MSRSSLAPSHSHLLQIAITSLEAEGNIYIYIYPRPQFHVSRIYANVHI